MTEHPWIETDDANDPCVLCVRWDFPPDTPDEDRWDGGLELPYSYDGQQVTRLYRRHHDHCAASMEAHTAAQSAEDWATGQAVIRQTLAVVNPALDVLEEIVRSQWTRAGTGDYRQPDQTTATTIAQLLATHRPERWTRIPIGLRWHPEKAGLAGLAPYDPRGPGGPDVVG